MQFKNSMLLNFKWWTIFNSATGRALLNQFTFQLPFEHLSISNVEEEDDEEEVEKMCFFYSPFTSTLPIFNSLDGWIFQKSLKSRTINSINQIVVDDTK